MKGCKVIITSYQRQLDVVNKYIDLEIWNSEEWDESYEKWMQLSRMLALKNETTTKKKQSTVDRNYVDNMWLNFSHQAMINILAWKLEDWKWLISFCRETDDTNAWNWNPQLNHLQTISRNIVVRHFENLSLILIITEVWIITKNMHCHVVLWYC